MIKSILKNKNSTNSMIAFLSSANLFNTFLTLLSGLLVIKWLLPEDLGLFTSFNLIVGYVIIGQLGISSGLSRELPYLMGKKEMQSAWHSAEVAQYWLLSIAVLSFLVLSVISIYYFYHGNLLNGAGFVTIAIVSFQSIYVTQYLKVLYRTNNDFNKISLIQIVTSLVSFGSIIFVWKWEFYGLCMRAVITAVMNFLLFWKWKPISVKPKWNKEEFIRILRIGFPMFSVAKVYGLWPVIQKTLIVTIGGPISLGLFAIANMVEGTAKTIRSSIGSILYTKMIINWGEVHSVNELLKLIRKPVFTVIIILAPLFTIAWFILPYLITTYLENYVEGVIAGQWMLVASLISVLFVYTSIYNVVNEQLDRLYCYLIGIVTWALVVLFLYSTYGFSIDIFPKGMIMGQLAIFIVTLFNINKYKNKY